MAMLRRASRDCPELAALLDHVAQLEAQVENLQAQNTGLQVGLDSVQHDVAHLEHQVRAARERADQAEQEAQLSRTSDDHQQHGAACAPGRHVLEAVPRPARLLA